MDSKLFHMKKKSQDFGKTYPLVNEMDTSLSDTPHGKRIDMVAESIILSPSTTNPFKLMKNAFDFNHSISGLKKASYVVASSKKISPAQA